MHTSSLLRMKGFKEAFLKESIGKPLQILDVGSSDVNGSYRSLFQEAGWQYTGADIAAGPNVNVVLQSPYDWRELSEAQFDVVVSGQALEHVDFFWITFLEIRRVLKPGGLCCLIAPSSGEEHRYPVDAFRFYRDGLAALARFARLEVLHVETEIYSPDYGDGGHQWKDSVLVARKSALDEAAEQSLATLAATLKMHVRHLPPASSPAIGEGQPGFIRLVRRERNEAFTYLAAPYQERDLGRLHRLRYGWQPFKIVWDSTTCQIEAVPAKSLWRRLLAGLWRRD